MSGAAIREKLMPSLTNPKAPPLSIPTGSMRQRTERPTAINQDLSNSPPSQPPTQIPLCCCPAEIKNLSNPLPPYDAFTKASSPHCERLAVALLLTQTAVPRTSRTSGSVECLATATLQQTLAPRHHLDSTTSNHSPLPMNP